MRGDEVKLNQERLIMVEIKSGRCGWSLLMMLKTRDIDQKVEKARGIDNEGTKKVGEPVSHDVWDKK